MDRDTKQHYQEMLRETLRPLHAYLDDPDVQEIMINGPNDVWVERSGETRQTNVEMSDIQISNAIEILAKLANKDALANTKDAIIDSRVEGMRIAAALPPISGNGPSICIRKHSAIVYTLDDLLKKHTLSKKAYDILATAIAEKKNILISGGTSSGKAQPLDSLVLTPNGFKRMGDMNVGDQITMPNGLSSEVIGVFPQGEKDIYRITFHDGRSAESCSEHFWKVWSRISVWDKNKKKKVRDMGWRVVNLAKVMEWIDKGKSQVERAAIPVVVPYSIEFEKSEITIHPYVIGALLGDGGLTDNQVRFSSKDEFILKKIQELLPSYELRPVIGSNCDYRIAQIIRRKVSPLRVELKRLGLWGANSSTKFIPTIYKNGTVAQRTAIVQGLMDTDGTVNKDGYLSFTTVSEQLAKDLQEILWSLGCIANITNRQTKFTNKNGEKTNGKPSFNIHINNMSPDQLVSLPRKLERIRKRERDWRLKITNIEYVGKKEAQCIAISDPSGLYVTNNYVVTHNTTILNALTSLIKDDERLIIIEDTREIRVSTPNHVFFESNAQAGVYIRDLVKLSLRYAPDRIIVGEIRGAEAFDLMRAMNSGHEGGLTTIHANNPKMALAALETLILVAGEGWPYEAIRNQVGLTFNYVVQVALIDGVRQLQEIIRVNKYDFERKDYDIQVLEI